MTKLRKNLVVKYETGLSHRAIAKAYATGGVMNAVRTGKLKDKVECGLLLPQRSLLARVHEGAYVAACANDSPSPVRIRETL